MTILTSATARRLTYGSDALSMLSAICPVNDLVLGPIQAGQSIPCPRQRCNLKARRFNEFRILQNPTNVTFTTAGFSNQLLHSAPPST